MAPLTPADVKRWDADAIHSVFQTASNRATTLQTLGDNLQQVHAKLTDWQGEAGDAFRADLTKARHDIEADGHESSQVAAAVSRAEADVRAVKAKLDAIEQAAQADGFAITSDWRIDSGSMKLDSAKAAAKQQLQLDLDACKLSAHSADQELAMAVRSAVGDMTAGSQPAADQPKTWQDLLLPTGPGSGDGAKGPPVPGDAGNPPSLQDMMTGHGTPANQRPPTGDPLDLLSRVQPAPPPQLKPADVEAFKAMARQTMVNDGVPPDQIEARLNAVVANTQQWLNAGAPNYVPPEPPKAPKPGFGEMFGNAWFANEDAIHSLLGQNGADAAGDAWGGMAKGLAGKAEEYLTMGPAAAIPDAIGEAKSFIDNPAGYLGAKSADAAMTAPFMIFGPEGAAARAGLGEGLGEMSGLDAASGLTHGAPGIHPPTGALEDVLPGTHLPVTPQEAPVGSGPHPSGPLEPPAVGGHPPSGPPEGPMPTGHPTPGPSESPVLENYHQTSAGDTDSHVPVDHSAPEMHHDVEPYAVDGDGHYLPGSLPSYEQLQNITATEPDRAFYWSGRNAEGIGVGPDDSGIAELIAHGSGGTTLEMTLAENGIDPLPVWNRHDPVSVQFWEDASASYAENAQGEVTGVIGSDLRPGNIWQSVEIPRLMENPDVIRIVQVDPDTGLSTVIFDRGK